MFISSSKGKKNEQNEEMANRRTVPQSIYWRKHLFKQYLWKIFTAAPPPSRKSPHRLSSFIPAVNNSSSSSEHFLGIHKFLQRYIILQSELWNAQLSLPHLLHHSLQPHHSAFIVQKRDYQFHGCLSDRINNTNPYTVWNLNFTCLS